MSSSSPASRPSWPRYGPVLLTRCPDCPRKEPLKRFTYVKEDHGNCGRDFVKCESRPQQGQVLEKCGHFEWLDVYIERLQLDGLIGANQELNSGPLAVEPENLADRAIPMMGNAELKGELKKISKELKQMVDLKQQANMMVGGFYCCTIVMGFF
ncbi:unnamed protein product [Triticum turgidum subsp. durum]|uniref:GRF-type domain-containing protein n=1 Tax=Triticum turgidum subsp. durum TaxID=4567 RepID=A0A9R1B728_TRITD|nr:unnamed protein product [Triticum turgidum subsp. durum]